MMKRWCSTVVGSNRRSSSEAVWERFARRPRADRTDWPRDAVDDLKRDWPLTVKERLRIAGGCAPLAPLFIALVACNAAYVGSTCPDEGCEPPDDGRPRFQKLALGDNHTCGLTEDGDVFCWGSSESGQREFAAEGPFVDIAAGRYFSCGVKAEGDVHCSGSNEHGQLEVPMGARFSEIAAGSDHVCGIKEDGSLLCWGAQNHNMPGILDAPPGTGFSELDASGLTTCALRGTRVTCWGNSREGLLQPRREEAIDVAPGALHVCSLSTSGEIACWGQVASWELQIPRDQPMLSIAAGGDNTCALGTDGTATCWGGHTVNPTGLDSGPPGVKFRQLYVGDGHACGIRLDSRATCWGNDMSGSTNAP